VETNLSTRSKDIFSKRSVFGEDNIPL